MAVGVWAARQPGERSAHWADRLSITAVDRPGGNAIRDRAYEAVKKAERRFRSGIER